MGSTQRLAAVAAISQAKRYYNHTQTEIVPTVTNPYTVNFLFVSITLCGVLVAVCAACWRRSPASDKPEQARDCHGVYTVSGDDRLDQVHVELPGPPPAYETIIESPPSLKDCTMLQEVVPPEPCAHCHTRCDSGLPSYEAAVMHKDTKL